MSFIFCINYIVFILLLSLYLVSPLVTLSFVFLLLLFSFYGFRLRKCFSYFNYLEIGLISPFFSLL